MLPSFADLLLSALVLGALLALLQARPRLMLSGALLGAVIGLKLSHVVFVPGFLAAALVASSRPSTPPWLALGGAAGFLCTGAPWAAYLWLTLGNPVFPAMNKLFASPSAAYSDFGEPHFLPQGVADALTYPWRIAAGQHPTAETAFADPRLLAALVLSAAALAGRRWFRPGRAIVATIVFIGTSAAAWLALAAIQRYAVALDIMAGLMAVLLASALGRSKLAAPVLAACALVAATRPADWWHRPWTDTYAFSQPAALAHPAAYLILYQPNGYWPALLPSAARFYSLAAIGLAPGGPLHQRVVDGLRAPPDGRVRVLGADVPMPLHARAQLAAYGFTAAAPCDRVPSLWWVDTVVCAAVRTGPRPDAAPDLLPGRWIGFSKAGSGWIYEFDGWAPADGAGVMARSFQASLVFTPTALAQEVVTVMLSNPSDAATDVSVLANTRPVARWSVPPGVGTQPFALAIGPGPVRLTLQMDRPGLVLHAMCLSSHAGERIAGVRPARCRSGALAPPNEPEAEQAGPE